MPTLTRTPFNGGGSYRGDSFDAIDQANAQRGDARSAMLLDLLGRQRESDNNFRLGMAGLGERRDEFGAGLAAQRYGLEAQRGMHNDDLNFQREGLQRQSDMFGKQFDYMRSRDAMGDQWRQKEWEAGQTGRDASNQAISAQTAMLLQQIEQMKADQQRRVAANNVQLPTDASDLERSEYQAAVGSGEAPAAAVAKVQEARRGKKSAAADALANQFGNQVADFKDRDTGWWDADPAQGEVEKLHQMRDQVRDAYVGAGMSPELALAKANEKVGALSDANHWNAGWTKALYQALGLR